jgi:hypothetical protein
LGPFGSYKVKRMSFVKMTPNVNDMNILPMKLTTATKHPNAFLKYCMVACMQWTTVELILLGL